MGSAEAVRPQVESLVEASDVVKLSDEDAEWLVPGVPVEELAAQWLQRGPAVVVVTMGGSGIDRKSTRLNSSHANISYAVFCLKKKNKRSAHDMRCTVHNLLSP